MCGSYSTETEKLYNVVINLEADQARAEEVAKAINVLTDFGYNVEVVEEKA